LNPGLPESKYEICFCDVVVGDLAIGEFKAVETTHPVFAAQLTT
jgi:hypothetical protein